MVVGAVLMVVVLIALGWVTLYSLTRPRAYYGSSGEFVCAVDGKGNEITEQGALDLGAIRDKTGDRCPAGIRTSRN